MGRQKKTVQVNQFVGGLNTEANPLSFPEGASFDESNCDLRSDGTRRRRAGFDVDSGFPVNTGISYPSEGVIGRNQFVWKSAGGRNNVNFLVIQMGNYVAVHSMEALPLSDNRVWSNVFANADPTITYGLTAVDGTLVIATGEMVVRVLEYGDEGFTLKSGTLLIRDLFGVQAQTLTEPQNFQVRPLALSDRHLYNLRNQTFALPRVDGKSDSLASLDPIKHFYESSRLVNVTGPFVFDPETGKFVFGTTPPQAGFYPSNADNLNAHLVADPNKETNRTVERFNPTSMIQTPPQNQRAPMGYFIIDALKRGSSRTQQFAALTSSNRELEWRPTVSLGQDRTPSGATTTAHYAGRVWFGGFSGEVVGGDSKSPALSSYLLFSQVVKEPSQIFWCYQEADPTSNVDPDLVETDGGFLKIDGAYGIKALVEAGTSLFVFAENGVWRIAGADENTFSATSYLVNKITDRGCRSPLSVVYVDSTLMYWADNAIYAIARDQVGGWTANNITESSLRSFFQSIPKDQKESCSGYFEDVANAVRWVYGSDVSTRTYVDELVLNVKFQVFTKNRIHLSPGVFGPITVSGGEVVDTGLAPVTVLGVPTTTDGEVVTSRVFVKTHSPSQNFYCNITQIAPQVHYQLGGYNNFVSPYDWASITPTDSPAFLSTGFITGGEARQTKDIPYLTTYFRRTEVEEEPVPSACLLQTRWDWSASPDGGRWTAPRSAYRMGTMRIDDTIVKSRNRVRGFGNSLAFHLSSEPGSFFHLLGWEHNLEATTDE